VNTSNALNTDRFVGCISGFSKQRYCHTMCRHICGRPSCCRGSYTRPLHCA